jgi:hypothetical protein
MIRSDRLWRIFRHSLLVFFAPIIGAIKGIAAEYQRLDQEAARARVREHPEA